MRSRSPWWDWCSTAPTPARAAHPRIQKAKRTVEDPMIYFLYFSCPVISYITMLTKFSCPCLVLVSSCTGLLRAGTGFLFSLISLKSVSNTDINIKCSWCYFTLPPAVQKVPDLMTLSLYCSTKAKHTQ